MHRRSTADAAFGVFVRRQIGDVFLIWIRILCFAHFIGPQSNPIGFPLGSVARLHGGIEPPCAGGVITEAFSQVGRCGRLWRLSSASDHALQLAVCLFSLRSYYLS